MTASTIPGAEPWSHVGQGTAGALVLHGFTGNPSSMRSVAEALAGAGFHVELPQLPGHGTAVEDMMPTRWADWAGEVEAAYQRLDARTDKMVVVGLSMGGSLALYVGNQHPEVSGLVCINPAAQPQPTEVIEMLQGIVDSGTEAMPAIGSDIADPDAHETAYEATPVRALISLMVDGLAPLASQYPSMHIPLLLMNSPQDHVVDPVQGDYLADQYGGEVRRVSLDRSFHVATQDYDKDLIVEQTVAFAHQCTEQTS